MIQQRRRSGVGAKIDQVVGPRQPVSAVTITFARNPGEKVRILSYPRKGGGLDHLSIYERNGSFVRWAIATGDINQIITSIVRKRPGLTPEISKGFPSRGEVPLPVAVGA